MRLDPTGEVKTEERRWYGWQIMLADVAAVGLLGASAATEERYASDTLPDTLATGGLGLWLLGGPTIHLAHGNTSKTLGSLALRGLLPLTGAFVGSSIGEARARDGFLAGMQEAAYGLLIGTAAAAVIDWTLLSYDTVTRTVPRARRHGGLAPSIGIGPSHVSLGLGGSF